MKQSDKNRLIFLLALLCGALISVAPSFFPEQLPDWWPAKPMRLGLDLKGGSYLVLSVKTEEAVKSQLNSVAVSVRSELRREKAGIIRAQQVGARGVQFVLLGERGVAKLEEHMQENYRNLRQTNKQPSGSRVTITYEMGETEAEDIKKNAVVQAIETIRNRVDQYGVTEPTIQRSGVDRIMVQLPDVTNIDTVKKTIGSVAKLEFRLVADVNTPEDETVTLKYRDGGNVRLEDEVLMTGDAIQTANVEINPQTNEIEVVLKLNSFGSRTFDRITAENVNRNLAIILDGVVQSSPQIRQRISGGNAQISGGFTREEAHRLAVVLRSGALPAPLAFEEERTIGASLGHDSITKGVNAILGGSVLVVAFVVLYYKKAGMLAVGCLFVNLLLLLASLVVFGATLTLPGLAGLALTIGMAVDANVIIYERIREELRIGASDGAAIDKGFLKAHWTILDSNLTTLLAGIILYAWGTGPIRGFAVTLCLGVLTSMFAALFVARLGFAFFKLKGADGRLSI